MASLPGSPPETDRRWVLRVPPDPYLRFDTCDYSLDPRLVGRRVEARVSEREVLAVALDTGELACRQVLSDVLCEVGVTDTALRGRERPP